MPDFSLSQNTIIYFFELQRQKDGEEWLIGREETSTYITLPEVGVDVIDLLQKQKTVGEVQKEIISKYGQELDMEDFVSVMLECGFIQTLDGKYMNFDHQQERRFFWPGLKPEKVMWLFSLPALIFYGIVLVWMITVWCIWPEYLPRYSDWFYHPSLTVVMISMLVLDWLHVAWHEFWHFLAARSEGVKADFSLGTRLIFVVAQTDVTGVWSIPQNRRYIVYLAGIIGNILLMAFYMALLALNDTGHIPLPTTLYRLLKALIFMQFWGIVWEFQFQIRTDIYYLVANLTNCKNLMQDSHALLGSIAHKLFASWRLPQPWKEAWAASNLSNIPEREMRIIRLYLPFYAIGTVVLLLNFFLRTLPITWQYVTRSISTLTHSETVSPVIFADAVVFVMLTSFTYGLLLYLKWRERQH